MARVWASVHSKGAFFLRRLLIGHTMFAYPGINMQWYPKTPNVEHTCLTDVSFRGQAKRPLSFMGLMRIVPASMIIPRYVIEVCSKWHLLSLQNRDSSARRSRTSCTIHRGNVMLFPVAINILSI